MKEEASTVPQPEKEPLITVLTVCYNSEATLARTIASVLAQSYERVEYIIVDGASEDRTLEIAASYEAAFREKGYIYRIVSEKDAGMYDALNHGVRLASGELIGQINSDDWYEPNALTAVAETYRETAFDYFWEDLRIIKASGNTVKKAKISRFATTRHWNHPTTFIRAEVYKAHPYSLLSMYDDFELILRLRREGYRPAIRNEVLANFCFGGQSTQKSLRHAMQRVGYRRRNYKKNGYGFLYTVDSFVMEMAKYILG